MIHNCCYMPTYSENRIEFRNVPTRDSVARDSHTSSSQLVYKIGGVDGAGR